MGMTLGIAILAHKDLNRTGAVARFLAEAGIYVAIHVDASVLAPQYTALQASLSDCKNIHWVDRIMCKWGEFSLVNATLALSTEILEAWPDVEHVLLISGDSLPVRHPNELVEFLHQNPGTDFIESSLVSANNWVANGLGIERFTLHFPFSWKTQRWLFDAWVRIQRNLRIKRKAPADLNLHIGSQWWCLCRQTLQAILLDPNKPAYDTYFQTCWIPDESYFHTLSRKHSARIESKSLVFSQFDYQGKPAAFYDDHGDALSALDEFFARKIWPGADGLYQRFTTH